MRSKPIDTCVHLSVMQVGSIHDISVLSRASVRTLEAKVFRRKILLYVCIGVLSIINMLLLIRMFNNGGSLYGHK